MDPGCVFLPSARSDHWIALLHRSPSDPICSFCSCLPVMWILSRYFLFLTIPTMVCVCASSLCCNCSSFVSRPTLKKQNKNTDSERGSSYLIDFFFFWEGGFSMEFCYCSTFNSKKLQENVQQQSFTQLKQEGQSLWWQYSTCLHAAWGQYQCTFVQLSGESTVAWLKGILMQSFVSHLIVAAMAMVSSSC